MAYAPGAAALPLYVTRGSGSPAGMEMAALTVSPAVAWGTATTAPARARLASASSRGFRICAQRAAPAPPRSARQCDGCGGDGERGAVVWSGATVVPGTGGGLTVLEGW